MCGYKSINELNDVNKNVKTKFRTLYKRNEYIPRMHGLRDAIVDIDSHQIEDINKSVILKLKENKLFRKNLVDGLSVIAWDGVELCETTKAIEGLPEREYEERGEIRKYVKFLCGMNIGPLANIMITSKQLMEVEKITTKSGKERAKTIGETKALEAIWKDTEKLVGRIIDVHVFDALYLNQNVVNMINDAHRYFVIRLKDESRLIYQDAKGLFEHRESDYQYEIVEHIIEKKTIYTKLAKKKDSKKTKIRKEKREITNTKLGEKKFISEKVQTRKNSTVTIKEYERVVARKEVWDDTFELTGYEEPARVVRSKEIIYRYGKEIKQEIYVVTNMLEHDVETILTIMHLRWNIENCGFRTLKQRYNLEHIFVGEINAINYMVQIIFLAFNLLELYLKVRLKETLDLTWSMITKSFEDDLRHDKTILALFNNSG